MSELREWWWPEITDAAWCQATREEYEDARDMSDDEIREEYADGQKYAITWDHVGDAYDEYEKLADAFLALNTRPAPKSAAEEAREELKQLRQTISDAHDLAQEHGHPSIVETLEVALEQVQILIKPDLRAQEGNG